MHSSFAKTLLKVKQVKDLSETMDNMPSISFGSQTQRFTQAKVDLEATKQVNFGLGSTLAIIKHNQIDELKRLFQMRHHQKKLLLSERLKKKMAEKPELAKLHEQEKQFVDDPPVPKQMIPSSFFKSTLDRFGQPLNNIKGATLEMLPGPGSYEQSERNKSSFSYRGSTFSQAQRKVFDLKEDSGAIVQAPASMVKRTYNVRLAANIIKD